MKKLPLTKFLLYHVATFLSAIGIVVFLAKAPPYSYSDLLSPYHRYFSRPPSPFDSVMRHCDIFRGEWAPDADAPYYTNWTCSAIQEHQNCIKYGRPDVEFLKWQWRPEGCELPRFNSSLFLEFVRNRTLAFVGDSLARNHMQSLLCLLSKVEVPKDMSKTGATDPNKILHYETYNFTIYIFWSPFLVRAHETAHADAANRTFSLWHLYLDEPDANWFSGVAAFDYLVVSAANWYARPSQLYEKGRLVGCSYCLADNDGVPDLTIHYSHRMAYRTVLRALADRLGGGGAPWEGKVIVRTLSPMSHFENGAWNEGGDCRRTRPYRSNETSLGGLDRDFYAAQVEEFREAEAAARAKGVRMMLMDATRAMLLRPDGHPSRYGHWPEEDRVLYNDCVHWCLPGPVDVWNNMLLQMLLL